MIVYEGQFTDNRITGKGVYKWPDGSVYEGDVKGFVKEYNLPVVKSPCPVDGSTKRENVKNLIGEINHQYPGAKARMIRAVIDDIVNPDCPPQN